MQNTSSNKIKEPFFRKFYNRLLRLHNYLKELSPVKFVLFMTLSTYLSIVVFLPLFLISWKTEGFVDAGPFQSEHSIIVLFIFAIIIAPILETLVYQSFIISLCKQFKFLNKKIIIIFISALAFSLSHTYSLSYIFNTLFIGMILAYAYLVYEDKHQSSYWIVCSIHALRNSLSLLLSILIQN
ncbi:CPBP family intramembrane glutamic endopeptidase [Crassaminicella profunda]|uniref:CPBP family intramembrane glutamic endopeptidase n=1 Tax=Crassaminicella profunda TaxID=1286698 RepID=UPI001CA64D21|nr:CPBP family intramembrane glutamic endopeptidase [Crassaminicella profunda]QZY55029.1 CPBP family intramembrane metalloprotease [Crassaminicella profunda]